MSTYIRDRKDYMPTKYTITATTYDKRGRVIATAKNSYTQTHPYQAKLGKAVGMPQREYLHAEVAAIIKSRSKEIFKIVVERYDNHGNPKTAAPCPICQRAIELAKIKRVEYTVG